MKKKQGNEIELHTQNRNGIAYHTERVSLFPWAQELQTLLHWSPRTQNCKPSSSIQPIQPGMTDYWLTHRPTHTPTQTTDLMTQTQTTQPSTQSEHRWIEEDENAVKWNWKDIYIAIYQVRWTAIYLQRLPHLPHLEPSTGYMHFPCGLNVWSTHVEPSIGYMYFRCGFERWSVIHIGVVLNVGVQYKLGV